MKLVMPIYWTKTFKTKPSKTVLVGLSWYRNAHYTDQHAWKEEFHEIVYKQIPEEHPVLDKYVLECELYYKNPSCDGSNIIPMIEKAVLDALQHKGVVKNDSVKEHLGTMWEIVEKDASNPRCEITIRKIEEI